MSTPTRTPQQTAREVLCAIGIEVIPSRTVVLTDGDSIGPRAFTHIVQPSQLAYAVDQHRLLTGEGIDGDALERRLPWLATEEDL